LTALALDFATAAWDQRSLDSHVEEPEVLDRADEPGCELHDPARPETRASGRVPERRAAPHDIVGQQRLPSRGVGESVSW
jgi:hypothetical protein